MRLAAQTPASGHRSPVLRCKIGSYSSAYSNPVAKSCRKPAVCRAVHVMDIAHYVQQEVTIEGVLQVSAAQAGSCMQRFEDFNALQAPALPALHTVLASVQDSSPLHPVVGPVRGHMAAQMTSTSRVGERVVNEAFCLATPPDNPDEGSSSRIEPVTARNTSETTEVVRGTPGRPQPARTTSRGLTMEAEEVLQLETAVCQRAYLSAQAMYSGNALQASAAVRRQRRRALLRLLRNGRDVTSNTLSALQSTPPALLLASIGSSICSMGSLGSWDDICST